MGNVLLWTTLSHEYMAIFVKKQIDGCFRRTRGILYCREKVKVRSYIARYPVRRTAQSALPFTAWQTFSFQGHLNFSGKHSAAVQLREDYSFTFPPLSVLPGTHLYS